MPNLKKFIVHTLHSLADYIEKGNCNQNQWEKIRLGLVENLELNRTGMTDEQYNEVLKNLASIRTTIGYLYLKLDAIEKSETEDAPSANIVSIRAKA